MFKTTYLNRIIFLIFIISLLTACSSMKTKDEDNDANRKIKTAKINCQLGIAYLERHNIQRAKQKLLLAITQAPTIPEPWYSMAYFLEATGNAEQAQVHYLKALEVAPNRGDAQNNYGTFLCRTGHYNESVQHFLMATKDPDYLDLADAYENAGLCSLKIPDDKIAIEYFKQALREDPDRKTSLFKLAETYYKIGDYSEAKNNLSQYLAIAPPNKQTLFLTSRLYVKKTQFAQGIRKILNTHVKNLAANKQIKKLHHACHIKPKRNKLALLALHSKHKKRLT